MEMRTSFIADGRLQSYIHPHSLSCSAGREARGWRQGYTNFFLPAHASFALSPQPISPNICIPRGNIGPESHARYWSQSPNATVTRRID